MRDGRSKHISHLRSRALLRRGTPRPSKRLSLIISCIRSRVFSLFRFPQATTRHPGLQYFLVGPLSSGSHFRQPFLAHSGRLSIIYVRL